MDEDYIASFELIALAGEAQSEALNAIQSAKKGYFEEALNKLKEANKKMNEAHDKQFKLLQNESNGIPVPNHIVMIHAQDHLTMAKIFSEMAKETIDLYKKIDTIE